MIRDDIRASLVAAMKARDQKRVAALRLIEAAIKNRDIEARTGPAPADDDALVAEVLEKLAKQRRESIALYEQGGRAELAEAERFELGVIESFLPARMDRAVAEAAIRSIIAELGASSARDMGRVMAEVKARLAGRIGMAEASALVKAALG